jgi:predicted TIM-barrel fold metal-dependent hydrolase
MTMPRRRFVDPHMHLWDLGQNPWYQFPTPGDDWGLGMKEPFPDRYVLDDYLASLAAADLAKCVHVTAVTGVQDVEAESRWIAEIAKARGLPNAIVGSVDAARSAAEVEAALDAAMEDASFRGIRLLGGLDYASAQGEAILSALRRRQLIYDAVAQQAGGISALAKALRRHEGLVVVLEHTGWPHALGADAFREWRAEMAELAALPNTCCKLSGLGMVVHSTDLGVFSKYFGACIEMFGPSRCMFASNFPVDLGYGSFDDLLAVFEAVAGKGSAEEADALFAGTAERVYRI